MRIMFVIDRLGIGGAELHTVKLAAQLAKRGHNIQTVVLLAGGSAEFPVDDFPVRPTLIRGRHIASRGTLVGLKVAISDLKPDVVLAVNQSALVAATAARVLGARGPLLCGVFHTTAVNTLMGRIRLAVYKSCVAMADALIFVSTRQCEYWSARGMRAAKTVSIPNGVDPVCFDLPADGDRMELRHRFGFSREDLVLLLVGRLAPEKNHSWLLSVLADMRREEVPDALRMRLVLIGDGVLRAELESQVAELDLSGVVTFVGERKNVGALLGMGDVGVLVSHAETLSLAALELMASGLPMIMTDVGGAREIVGVGARSSPVGLLVRPGDSAALRRALLEMAETKRRTELGAQARQRVIDHFSVDGMVDRYESFLVNDLVGSKCLNGNRRNLAMPGSQSVTSE